MKKLIILSGLVMALNACGDKPHSKEYYHDNLDIARKMLATTCKQLPKGDDSVTAQNCRNAKIVVMNNDFFK